MCVQQATAQKVCTNRHAWLPEQTVDSHEFQYYDKITNMKVCENCCANCTNMA